MCITGKKNLLPRLGDLQHKWRSRTEVIYHFKQKEGVKVNYG